MNSRREYGITLETLDTWTVVCNNIHILNERKKTNDKLFKH